MRVENKNSEVISNQPLTLADCPLNALGFNKYIALGDSFLDGSNVGVPFALIPPPDSKDIVSCRSGSGPKSYQRSGGFRCQESRVRAIENKDRGRT